MVEDNSADVFLLRYALDAHGEDYRLEVLRDGEQAIEFVERQRSEGTDGEPCVIVLDLHLPKHSGGAVLKVIRDEPVLAHVHVIALSTLASPREEQEVRELGVRLYRAKPTLVDDWIKLAAEILEVCRGSTRVAA